MNLKHIACAFERAIKTLSRAVPTSGPEEVWDGPAVYADVSSVTEITNGTKALLVMTVSERTALELVHRIGGVHVNFDSDLVPDVVGEILNVTAGSAQKASGGRFTIPRTERARRHLVADLIPGCTRVLSRLESGNVGLYLVQREAPPPSGVG